LPIWLGVGGTPASFERAGQLGLPLMLAVIGGQTHRFNTLVNLYKSTAKQYGHKDDDLKLGLHSFGYVANSRKEALDDFYPGYARVLNAMKKERGWVAPTREQFENMTDEKSAIVIGDPDQVAQKILRHSEALGGISRFTFQMDVGLSHEQLKRSIALIGQEVKPRVLRGL
jgi:alkanesulfonate monooxygenase SsuD/methylene tetrahydromethanopterin reductase-like flavin-dependent oxidoreductase (luciferase family)